MNGDGDRRIDVVIGRLLQAGVLTAAAIVLTGAAILLARQGRSTADYGTFRGTADALRSLTGIVRAATSGDSLAIIQLGLVVLIATPVARVALTLAAFLLRRDRVYSVLTAIVLALLLFSLAS